MTEPLPSSSLGPALRRWRLLHRVKQTHAAELLGVAQSTISRWESGTQALLVEERARLERLLGARLEAAADKALARLVEANPQPVHLICDLTHRLLACSPARAAQFGVPLGELLDRSLWPYCSEEILRQEATLEETRLARTAGTAGAGVRQRSERLGHRADPAQPLPLDPHDPLGRTRGTPGGNPLNVAADILSMDLQHRRA
ncbi:transcriptional regulator [Pseudomonas aeruginosa]|nr:transcriptional regulator [Pseudomonas aeruginosa]